MRNKPVLHCHGCSQTRAEQQKLTATDAQVPWGAGGGGDMTSCLLISAFIWQTSVLFMSSMITDTVVQLINILGETL